MEKETLPQTLTIYLYMDDSGKLSTKEEVSVFAGISFTSRAAKDSFNRQYKTIINDIKCSYCSGQKDTCSQDCPEVKNFNIQKSHKRRIINLCKKYCTYGAIIDNQRIYPSIMKSKASKGRYTDYAQKILIKEVVLHYIDIGVIDPQKDLNLIIQIDQQSTKSNGYYSLQESIDEELSKGIINFNYNMMHKPVIHGKLNVKVDYLDSKKVYCIQASDIIAGTVRSTYLHAGNAKERNEKLNSFLTVKKMLP